MDDWDCQRARRTIRDIRINSYVMRQDEFAAEVIGVSVGALISWETGHASPRISTRQKVAEKLGLRWQDIQWDVPVRRRTPQRRENSQGARAGMP